MGVALLFCAVLLRYAELCYIEVRYAVLCCAVM
jgi:hypothetical protein